MKQLIGHEKRRKIPFMFLLQRGRCAICGGVMEATRGHARNPKGWTVEHVIPRSEGGGRGGNLLLSHSDCNNKKGGAQPMNYMKRMANDIHIIFEYMNNPKTKLNQRQRKILHGEGA